MGEPLFVPDVRSDDRFSSRVDEQTWFESRDGSGYTYQDFIAVQTIADFTAIAFANAMLYEESENQRIVIR